MKSEREVIREYNSMLKKVADRPMFGDNGNGINCYVCEDCGHITKTIDIDLGVTPFMHVCESCGSWARSTMYKDINPTVKPTQEWYRPSLKQCLKMRKHEAALQHILDGGLDFRTIKLKDDGKQEE